MGKQELTIRRIRVTLGSVGRPCVMDIDLYPETQRATVRDYWPNGEERTIERASIGDLLTQLADVRAEQEIPDPSPSQAP